MLTDLIIGEMYRGTPIVYADYLGYDEVAHHAGPERPESLDELDHVDRVLRTLWRASHGAPRDYHFILLSDHGQSQGATFDERYGLGLEELLRRLMTGGTETLAAMDDVESWGPVNAFFTEVIHRPGKAGRMTRRALGKSASEAGVVTLGPDAERGVVSQPLGRDTKMPPSPKELPDLVVAASGNLANIYFPGRAKRLSLEDMVELHPGLMEGLVSHPGIAFALVRSDRFGAIVIGRQGIHYLHQDRVEGEDPLEPFGPTAPDNLRRLDSFEHVGDILVNSMYDPSTEEIAPFEHQVGAHGGLGGTADPGVRAVSVGARGGPGPRLAHRCRGRQRAYPRLDRPGAGAGRGDGVGRAVTAGYRPRRGPGDGARVAPGPRLSLSPAGSRWGSRPGSHRRPGSR